MEINERIKAIRKNENLSQREFGKRLGVTDVAISRIESGERGLTDQMSLSMCREFGINEEWLRTGAGEMFVENDGTILAALSDEFGLDGLDQKLVETFLKLPENERAAVTGFFVKFARELEDGETGGIEEYIASHPASVVAPPRADAEISRELTEDEYLELARARFRASKMGNASSTTLERQA